LRHEEGELLEMKAFLHVDPMGGSVYYALAVRGSPEDSLSSYHMTSEEI
jgi:hypothetical protein